MHRFGLCNIYGFLSSWWDGCCNQFLPTESRVKERSMTSSSHFSILIYVAEVTVKLTMSEVDWEKLQYLLTIRTTAAWQQIFKRMKHLIIENRNSNRKLTQQTRYSWRENYRIGRQTSILKNLVWSRQRKENAEQSLSGVALDEKIYFLSEF